jgi:hypothetical protein
VTKWTGFIRHRKGTNETLGSARGGEPCDQLSGYKLFKDRAPVRYMRVFVYMYLIAQCLIFPTIVQIIFELLFWKIILRITSVKSVTGKSDGLKQAFIES